MEQVLNRFCLDGCPVSCERYGEGHINLTFLVVTDTGKRYILQRLSRAAFSDIPGLILPWTSTRARLPSAVSRIS